MLDDLFKSLHINISEKWVSPLWGSFAVAWCVINYKFLVILFTAGSTEKIFDLIPRYAYPEPLSWFKRGIAAPAIASLVYIFIYPYFHQLIYWHTRLRQKETAEIRQKTEDEMPLTMEQIRKIRAAAQSRIIAQAQEIDRLNEELERYKALEASLTTKQDDNTLAATASISTPLTSAMFETLKIVNAFEMPATEEQILKSLSASDTNSRNDARYILGELESKNLLKMDYGADGLAYELTHEGRRTLKENEDKGDKTATLSSTQLDQAQLAMLRYIQSRTNGRAFEKAIHVVNSNRRLHADYELDELQRKMLIIKRYSRSESDMVYELTPKGREVLVNSEKSDNVFSQSNVEDRQDAIKNLAANVVESLRKP